MEAKVYFTDMRSKGGSGLLTKLDRLVEQAGFAQLINANNIRYPSKPGL